MRNYYNQKLLKLEEKLDQLSINSDDPIQIYEIAIDKILLCLSELKQFIVKKGFVSDADEILFFKELKPNIVSKLIYYNAVYNIESKKPNGKSKEIKKYIALELSKLKRYFDNNLDFYRYYRTNSTYLDHKYFIRGKHDFKLGIDSFYFEFDHQFATSHDYKVSKIIANDLIQVYLQNKLNFSKKRRPHLQWTTSKTSLIELIYGLYSKGVFNNGNADIKAIAQKFEQTFDIKLGNFYQSYLELRNRKINPTKFIDSIRESLLKKMEEQDEK